MGQATKVACPMIPLVIVPIQKPERFAHKHFGYGAFGASLYPIEVSHTFSYDLTNVAKAFSSTEPPGARVQVKYLRGYWQSEATVTLEQR
jgi:hypothetical protein